MRLEGFFGYFCGIRYLFACRAHGGCKGLERTVDLTLVVAGPLSGVLQKGKGNLCFF